jgi:hypothetical protein
VVNAERPSNLPMPRRDGYQRLLRRVGRVFAIAEHSSTDGVHLSAWRSSSVSSAP